MFTIELAVLLTLCGALAAGSLVHSLRSALPQVAGLRRALRECPEVREVRFTVRTLVVRYDDGKVVPLRPRGALSLPDRRGERAAA
jgi:hypothetical protein